MQAQRKPRREGRTSRAAYYATAASVTAMLVLVSVALGSTNGRQAPEGKSLVAIRELGSSQMTADKTFKGKFILALDGVNKDTGSTIIHPNEGALKTVAGQQQTTVFGNENLTSKKGTLNLAFRGVSIAIKNIDPTKDPFDNESGTWQIAGGTGAYKGWKGGGRWALVATPSANNIEWDGYVTH